jgi:hypothetical protein
MAGERDRMAESIESMTLQEKVKKTEQLVRELIEHLELGFSPKLKKLQKISRSIWNSVFRRN